MSQLELKRARLQTLARVLSGKGKLTVTFEDVPSTDLKNIKLRLVEGQIVPGVNSTRAQCWVAMKAAAAHESAHIRFTSMKTWEKAVRHSRLMTHLVNIIEDARIERCMSNLYPGTLVWFRFLNDYIFLNKKDWGKGPNALMGGLISYAVVGRLPVSIQEQKDVAELVYRCAPHIDRGRCALDTETVFELAREVFEIVRDFLGSYSPPPLPDTMGTLEPEKAPGGELDPRRNPLPPEEPGDDPGEVSADPEKTPDALENAEHEKRPGGETYREPVDDAVDSTCTKTDETGPDDLVPREDPHKAGDGEPKYGEDPCEPKDAPESEDGFSGVEAEDCVTDKPDEDSDMDEPNCESSDSGDFDDKFDFEDDRDDSGESCDWDDNIEDPELPEEECGEYNEPSGSDSGYGDGKEEGLADNDNDCGEPLKDHDGCQNEEKLDPIDMDEYSALMDEAGEELAAIESATSRAEKEAARETVPEIDELEITKELSKGIHKGCVLDLQTDFMVTDSARAQYENIYSEVKPYINRTVNEIQKVLEYKTTLTEKNLRKGKLHGNSLWKLHAKDPKVFYRVNEPNDIPKLAAYLLVDCSGSMTGLNISEAKKAACLLYETCVALKIPVCITGFTSEIGDINSVNHYRVISFEDDYQKRRYSIHWLNAQSQNRDGYSIRVATKELLLRNEQQKVLIVLSDGIPAASYQGYSGVRGVNDTAIAVREAEKREIGVIGLYFGPANHLKQAQKIYNNCIYVSDISVLPLVIGRVLKKIITGL